MKHENKNNIKGNEHEIVTEKGLVAFTLQDINQICMQLKVEILSMISDNSYSASLQNFFLHISGHVILR